MTTKTCSRGHEYPASQYQCQRCIAIRKAHNAGEGNPDTVERLRELSLASRLALKDHPYAVKLPAGYISRNHHYTKV